MADAVDSDSGFEVVSLEITSDLERWLSASILSNRQKVFSAYLLIIFGAEILTLFKPFIGFILHSILLLVILVHGPLIHRIDPKASKLLIAIVPVPLVRLVSITSPIIQFTILQWFLVIALILFSSIAYSVHRIGGDLSDYGFRLPGREHLRLELLIIPAGLLFGFLEYQILTPHSIIEDMTIIAVLAPLLALYFGTGLLEELLFRGLIQTHGIEVLGTWQGIAFTTFIFMAMHIGWESVWDVFFVGVVGLVYSLVVLRTGSIIGVSFSHAMTNLALFVLVPEIWG